MRASSYRDLQCPIADMGIANSLTSIHHAMGSSTEACVLCLRVNGTLTREHIFARWLVRQVHGGQLLPSDVSRAGTLSSLAPTRIARVVAGVGAQCNAGWMSSLEMSFRRILFARPRVGTLPAPDRITLSRWFTKTAVLLAHAHGSVLVGETDRARLARGMPDGIEVF